MARSALVLIGQIAAGKTAAVRAVAERTGARTFSVEDVRDPGRPPLQALGDAVAAAGLDRIVVECSGATDDFETFLLRLGALYYTVTVVKLVCSVETAYRRLRTTRAGQPPRAGAWPVQLRWVERRLRAVPADATIETDAAESVALADAVLARWPQAARGAEDTAHEGRDTFSFSQLAAFERCPLAYRFRYLERRPGRYRFRPELVGRLVHEGLARLYWTSETSGAPPLGELLASVSANAADLSPEAAGVGLVDSIRNEATAILRQHHTGAFGADRRRTLAVERRFEIDLGGGLSFVGIIDRLTESEAGIPVVIDYKTASAPPRPSANVPDLLQLEAYGLAALLDSRASVVEIRRHYVRTGVEELEVLRRSDIPRVRQALARWIRRVSRAPDFTPRPTKLCAWCTYNPACPSRLEPMQGAVEMLGFEERFGSREPTLKGERNNLNGAASRARSEIEESAAEPPD